MCIFVDPFNLLALVSIQHCVLRCSFYIFCLQFRTKYSNTHRHSSSCWSQLGYPFWLPLDLLSRIVLFHSHSRALTSNTRNLCWHEFWSTNTLIRTLCIQMNMKTYSHLHSHTLCVRCAHRNRSNQCYFWYTMDGRRTTKTFTNIEELLRDDYDYGSVSFIMTANERTSEWTAHTPHTNRAQQALIYIDTYNVHCANSRRSLELNRNHKFCYIVNGARCALAVYVWLTIYGCVSSSSLSTPTSVLGCRLLLLLFSFIFIYRMKSHFIPIYSL